MAAIHILVADDFPPLRQLLTRTLSEHFRVLLAVTDGKQLVDCARILAPDLIVSDVHMPVLTGIEAMRLLKGGGCQSAFVLVSADEAIERDCLEAGADAFVLKDEISGRLADTVRRVLASRLHACQPEPLPADAKLPEVRPRSNR